MPLDFSPVPRRRLLLSIVMFTAAPTIALAQTAHAAPGVRPDLELIALLGSCALLLVFPQLYANAASLKFGIPTMLGNREGFPELTGWMGRTRRAELNLQTNLIPFAAVVLTLAILGVSNEATRAGALLFLAARGVHAVAYIAGVPVVRTLSLYAGLAGTLLAAWPLVTILA